MVLEKIPLNICQASLRKKWLPKRLNMTSQKINVPSIIDMLWHDQIFLKVQWRVLMWISRKK
jgi:hypothetical protein